MRGKTLGFLVLLTATLFNPKVLPMLNGK